MTPHQQLAALKLASLPLAAGLVSMLSCRALSEPNIVGGRLRKKRSIRGKPHLSGKSDVWTNFSLIFEKRHDVHDSASCDFYVLWIGLRVGLGPKTAQN